MWKKIWNWLKTSHRLEHIVVSIVIGLLMNNLIYTAITASLVGISLEYKDKAYGGKWDWLDLTLTIVPALFVNWIKTFILQICS